MLFLFTYSVSTEFSTLSLHDALPIFALRQVPDPRSPAAAPTPASHSCSARAWYPPGPPFLDRHRPTHRRRSEEHTSELQSLTNLVCRLLLEKKKQRAPHNNN